MITTTLVSLVALVPPTTLPAQEVELSWSAPAVFVRGKPYRVELVAEAGAEGGVLPEWQLSPAAFSAGGKPLGPRPEDEQLRLFPAGRVEVSFDLGPALEVGGDFELGYDPLGAKQAVQAFQAVPAETSFLDMPVEQLGRYLAVLETNHGTMVAEMWPDVAPNHARNFLDLCNTGFYDQVLFHRVIPGFMIQGGDPLTKDPNVDPRRWGTGSGPRELEAEFNDKKHVRGVLSMARTADPNSATSQFFVCHATAPHLDRQYSGFGMLVDGFQALDAIANAPRGANDRPNEPQRIERAYAVLPLAPK